MEGYRSKAKMELLSNKEFDNMLRRLRRRIDQSTCSITDSSHLNGSLYCPLVSKDTDFFYGHPKLNRLEEVVLDHFRNFQSDEGQTRVMIFSQYRDSVREIADMLSRHAPLVRVMSFMGHATTNRSSKGQTHKEQIEVQTHVHVDMQT